MSSAPESLHLRCNSLMQSRVDHRVYVLADIVAVHDELRAALHQLILGIAYRIQTLSEEDWQLVSHSIPTCR